MKKILVAPLLLLSLSLTAAPIGEKRAQEIADARTRNIATKRATRTTTSTRSGSLLYTTSTGGKAHLSTTSAPCLVARGLSRDVLQQQQ